ncbi:16S rRNA (guanine(966)-N(2))-methyltransferase RsmD [Ovoidimarina sediminis]|uniref:16S rRNA (guanine(966)-N(2))-methyltransferase RsmD n=1 Tax=Ovoidimarina sediminis TaxID=3079856 RepID=UPI002911F641|nr:16S rRNA (guanine(966)-N(2))-methyltransferase RsmD [Rhodophyticola sp. MJ-SS7]MDU8945304.1 16S rRNA (guanine(966)-N(2))-methyltransferase RsmD [Rhodophyticola sp. MJ-SS7]
MRIVGGEWRGLALAGLGKGDPAAHLRPTSDRVRESLFSTLEHGGFGDPVPGARVLDLFAGTGALGLEALSRGAEHADFVESGRPAQRLIAENIARTRAGDRASLVRHDATRLFAAPAGPATLVFLDPPYGRGLGSRALTSTLEAGWIGRDALIVWEEEAEMPAPPGFVTADHRQYGGTHITFLRRA